MVETNVDSPIGLFFDGVQSVGLPHSPLLGGVEIASRSVDGSRSWITSQAKISVDAADNEPDWLPFGAQTVRPALREMKRLKQLIPARRIVIELAEVPVVTVR